MAVPATLPYHTGGGVAMVNWAVLQELRRRGHEVLVAADSEAAKQAHDGAALADVEALGARVVAAETPAGLQALALSELPDLLYCYSIPPLQRASLVRGIPTVAVVGDLDHQVELYRRQYYLRSRPISYAELAQIHNRAMVVKDNVKALLKRCSLVLANCHHHSRWLADMEVPNTYVPNPVADPCIHEAVRHYPENPTPRVSLAGHLGGIATLSGLYFLAEDLLPHLLREGLDCQIRIAGAESLFPDIAARLMPYMGEAGPVRLLGYVEDIHRELQESEVFLCPTPIDLGVRTRIIEAWALGCCVVAHGANALGFAPGQLVHGENCLVGNTGEELAAQIKTALGDKWLRLKLGQAGRATYEKHHQGAAGKTVDLVEAVATRRVPQEAASA